VAALAPTPDGTRVLTVDRTATRIRLLQRVDGRVLREWAWPPEPGAGASVAGPQAMPTALAVSVEAGVLLAARRDSTLVAYALDTPGARQIWRGHAQPVRSVAVSGNGLRAASGGDDSRILWWDVPAGRLLRVVAAGAGVVDALALSSDAAWLATGGADGQVKVWDMNTDRLAARLDPKDGPVRALAFAAGAAWLASAGADGSVSVWDLSTRSVVRRLSSPARVAALAFADPAGSVLVAGTEDGRLLTWTLGTGAAR
jgi:WD40 repeat protein